MKKKLSIAKKGWLSLPTMLMLLIVIGIGFLVYTFRGDIGERIGVESGLAVVQVTPSTSVSTATVSTDGQISDLSCLGIDQITWTPTFKEKYNPTTNVLDQFAYKLNGVEESSTATPGTSINVPPRAKIQLLTNSNYSTSAQTTWYSITDEFTAPCEKFTTITEVPDITSSMLTFKCINTNNNNINAASDPWDLTVGQTKSISCNVEGTAEDQFGVNSLLICAEWNNTGMFDDVTSDNTVTVAKPGHVSTVSGFKEDCYKYSALLSNGDFNFKLTIDTNDDFFDAGQSNISLTAVDDAGYRNVDNLNYEIGYETNKQGEVGAADETATIYII